MKNLLFSVMLIMSVSFANAQGCSDAGFCSIGNLQSGPKDDSLRSSLGISQSIGLGEQHSWIYQTQIETEIAVSSKTSFGAKLPWGFTTGNLGKLGRLGDLTLSWNQRLWQQDNRQLRMTLGFKTASNKGNEQISDNVALPMPYQASLGTDDIMAGFSWMNPRWQISLGYQHPLNRNENGFVHLDYLVYHPSLAYLQSANLKRGDDIMIRFQRTYKLEKTTFSLGALPIIRIEEDEIMISDVTEKLDGSAGLTLNLNAVMLRQLGANSAFRFSWGSPVIWRKVRADGLTRSFIIAAGLEWKF